MPVTQPCLNCQVPLPEGRRRFCSHSCEYQNGVKDVSLHNIEIEGIVICARFAAGEPEWILPGGEIVTEQNQAEAAAKNLSQWIEGKAA
jgi:hypothetical protein